MNDTVTAPRTIVHRIVIHQLRLAVHQILRLYDFVCIHILMIKKYVLYIEQSLRQRLSRHNKEKATSRPPQTSRRRQLSPAT
ncbi:hypothetical protein Barb4_05446 [Bacteroidales bacterium Barb4]|nr:hypothetical protein Barb4_05446 [Bacteroidales bacterium Barb4]